MKRSSLLEIIVGWIKCFQEWRDNYKEEITNNRFYHCDHFMRLWQKTGRQQSELSENDLGNGDG